MARKTKEISPLFPIGEQKETTESKTEQQTTKVEEPENEAPTSVTEAQSEDHRQSQAESSSDVTTFEEKKEEPKSTIEENKYSKYKKEPKYKTYVPHNVRIPKELRRDLERIAKKLGIPLGKNTGFFQEFTIDALQAAVDRAKKELGIDD